MEWLQKAANANELRAIRNLEFIYKEGLKTERNPSLSTKWKVIGDDLESNLSSRVIN